MGISYVLWEYVYSERIWSRGMVILLRLFVSCLSGLLFSLIYCFSIKKDSHRRKDPLTADNPDAAAGVDLIEPSEIW